MNIRMNWGLGFVLSLLFILGILPEAHAAPSYDLTVRIDPQTRQMFAKEDVVVTNSSAASLNEVVFHIYPHRVYTAQERNFMRRFASYFAREPFPEGFQTGSLQMTAVQSQGQDLTYTIQGQDQTLLKIQLPQPLSPQEQITIHMEFIVQIPHIAIGRFGFHDDVFKLTRWYPILSVYQEGQGWDQTPFYPFHRPFYSEASDYRVKVTAPSNQVLAHSGIERESRQNADGTKTYTYASEGPIREFTLAMSPQYQFVTEEWEGITLISYFLPGHEAKSREALRYAKQAMAFYTKYFGKYPYSEFRIVPVDLGYGGEQMSNLIFIDRRAYDLPGFMRRYFDFLISHETGHQWLYNLVGTNEYKEMWIEEGINSYLMNEYLVEQYGEEGEVFDFPKWMKGAQALMPKLTFKQTRDTRYKMMVRQGMDHPVVGELASFSDPSGIFSVTYGKGSRVLSMLHFFIGEDVLERVFRRMVKEYAYKNLTLQDFKRLCEEESHENLTWFFEQWFYQAQYLDYAIASVGHGQIILKNKGTAHHLPVDLDVVHQDGQTEHLTWDGTPRLAKIPLHDSSPVSQVTMDPNGYFIDVDRTNNIWPRQWKMQFVPLYHGLYEISTFLDEDQYTVTVGPSLDQGLGLKASLQKPYDQIFYTQSHYEFNDHLWHSGFGYELKNVLQSPLSAGLEMNNTTDYHDGSDDLVSGKIFLRRELWPAPYNVTDINDHVSLYLLRNQSLSDRPALSGAEAIRQVDYSRSESIVGTALALNRSGTSPDPTEGYKLNIFAENAGHYLGATQYFNRAAIDAAVYVPVSNKTRAAVRLKFGGGYPNDKPLFYAGGMDGLRGYALKSVRGANLLLGSVEYRFPILDHLNWSGFDHVVGIEKISGVLFADAGQAWGAAIDSSALRKDAGLGLRLMMNIGAMFQQVILRLDIAQAIEDEHEDEPRYWFGLNHAF